MVAGIKQNQNLEMKVNLNRSQLIHENIALDSTIKLSKKFIIRSDGTIYVFGAVQPEVDSLFEVQRR